MLSQNFYKGTNHLSITIFASAKIYIYIYIYIDILVYHISNFKGDDIILA